MPYIRGARVDKGLYCDLINLHLETNSQFDQALNLDPNAVTANLFTARIKNAQEKFDEAESSCFTGTAVDLHFTAKDGSDDEDRYAAFGGRFWTFSACSA